MTDLESLPIQLRLYDPKTDLNYIISSWNKSDRYNGDNKSIPSPIYYAEHQLLIKDIINKSQIMIAHLDDTPDIIVAYIIYEYKDSGLVIHQAFTHKNFQRQGIQRKMVNEINILDKPIIITNKPCNSLFLYLKNTYACVYNPYLIWRS